MKKSILFKTIFLFLLGLMGIVSTLTMELPIDPKIKAELLKYFTPNELKLVAIVNPAILLFVAVLAGIFTYKKSGFKMPLIDRFFDLEDQVEKNWLKNTGFVLLLGFVCGLVLGSLSKLPFIPEQFKELETNFQPNLLVRFLYGGITEEIMMRFGFMSLVVWLSQLITKQTNAITYWIGILISSLLFAAGHLPVLFQAVPNPEVSMIVYVILGNAIGGIVFGWVYWKKGLEYAFLAHIFAHVGMLVFATIQ